MTWDWSQFEGSAAALKWNRKELSTLHRVCNFVANRGVAVQAGSNLGIFPKYLARFFKTVYTFEPDAELFVKSVRNAPERNIIRFQAALGDTAEQVGISRIRRDGKPDNHEGIAHVSGKGNVPTMVLDDLNLERVDLLYLDIEGYEMKALRGSLKTIARCKPVIVCEVNKCTGFVGITQDDLRNFIIAQGYKFSERIRSDEVFLPC